MTIPSFSIPAVQSYLLSAIQSACSADSLYQSMLVILGQAATNNPNDIIALGPVRASTKPQTFIGSGGEFWLNETYTVEVQINTWVSIGDADGTSTIATQINNRAWQLASYVSEAVRLDPSLNGLVNQCWPSSEVSTGPAWSTSDAGGLGVGITMQLSIADLN